MKREFYCPDCELRVHVGLDGILRLQDGRVFDAGSFTNYCTGTPSGKKKIGHDALWTGNAPGWCPKRRAALK